MGQIWDHWLVWIRSITFLNPSLYFVIKFISIFTFSFYKLRYTCTILNLFSGIINVIINVLRCSLFRRLNGSLSGKQQGKYEWKLINTTFQFNCCKLIDWHLKIAESINISVQLFYKAFPVRDHIIRFCWFIPEFLEARFYIW